MSFVSNINRLVAFSLRVEPLVAFISGGPQIVLMPGRIFWHQIPWKNFFFGPRLPGWPSGASNIRRPTFQVEMMKEEEENLASSTQS